MSLKMILFSQFTLLLSAVLSFTPPQFSFPGHRTIISTSVGISEMEDWSAEMQAGDGNPCWQDIYDDDCSMESIYSASFVAAKWIKSMPCGAGIEDCDMPESLQIPSAREDGVASIDVMAFLGLDRKSPSEEAPPN